MFWRSSAKHTQRIEEAYKRAVAGALKGLPPSLAAPLKPPAERLCLDILSYEGAFQNRRLSPGKIEVLLRGLLYYWLFDRSQQLQLPNLLTRGESGEATFPVPLYRLHADVANSIQNVYYTIGQHSSPDATLAYDYPFYNYPFKRVALTLYRNWAQVNGFNSARGEEPPKKGKGIQPEHLKDKISAEELIRRFLGGTPFLDFLNTELAVSIPVNSRFEHMHIVGGSGHGKTQLLQRLILADLDKVRSGRRSLIVIDSQGDMFRKIEGLATVGAMAERMIIIDPTDIEAPPALNLFDFGLDRLQSYSAVEREMLINGAVALYEYIFGALLGAELTQKQGVIFRYIARLMMVVPNATIWTLITFMENPEATRPYLGKLDKTAAHFFESQFFDKRYDDTRRQISTRLWGVVSNSVLERMFSSERNKVNLFEAMNRGSLILINTAKDLLKQEGCEILGRFFIALICQAAQERAAIPEERRTPTFVYIDEAHDYFDESMENMLTQARKYQVALVLAHQFLGQFDTRLREAVMANTTVKLVGGLSARDADKFAEEMNCQPEFLQGLRKHTDHTYFAGFIRNRTHQPLLLKVDFGAMEHQPKLTPQGLAFLREQNRRRFSNLGDTLVGGTNVNLPKNLDLGLILRAFLNDQRVEPADSPLGKPELL